MELIVISDSKLKIMLTAPDMIRYDLEGSTKSCTDEKTRAAFRHIFDDARRQIGFDTEGERLFVQMYASREGGCEIFVTKLGSTPLLWEDEIPLSEGDAEGEALTDAEKNLLERICAADASLSRLETSSTPAFALRLDTAEALVGICRALRQKKYQGESYAYIEETLRGDAWYLFLSPLGMQGGTLPTRYAIATEFGTECPPGETALYLCEHGRCICPANAVAILGNL